MWNPAAPPPFAPLFAPRYGWPTVEMSSRGDPLNLAIGIVFAVASGLVVGVAVSVFFYVPLHLREILLTV